MRVGRSSFFSLSSYDKSLYPGMYFVACLDQFYSLMNDGSMISPSGPITVMMLVVNMECAVGIEE